MDVIMYYSLPYFKAWEIQREHAIYLTSDAGLVGRLSS